MFIIYIIYLVVRSFVCLFISVLLCVALWYLFCALIKCVCADLLLICWFTDSPIPVSRVELSGFYTFPPIDWPSVTNKIYCIWKLYNDDVDDDDDGGVMSHYITHNITKGTVKSNQLILPLSRYLSAVSFLYKLHIMCALLKIYRLVNCGWRVCASVCACILLYKYLLDLGEAMTVQLCMNFKGKIVAFLNEHTLFIYEWMKDRQIVYVCVCVCIFIYVATIDAHTQLIANISTILVGIAFSLMMSSPVSDF